jgi:Calx-beta domain-containing protein
MRLTSRARGHWKLIAVIGAVGLLAAACKPAVTGQTTGPIHFESTDTPAYTTGTVHNQNGWLSAGAAGSGCAVYDHEVDDVSAVGTQPSSYGFGDQALRISSAVTSGCFGDQTFSPPTQDEAGETSAVNGGQHSGGQRRGFFDASWSFADAGNPLAVQTDQHVVVSPDRGDGARMSWVEMNDCSATAQTDPDIDECHSGNAGLEVGFYEYIAGGTGFVYHSVANGLNRSVKHDIRLRMWFFEGADNDVVQVCVDGTTCVSGRSWEDYFRENEDATTRTVDSLLFRTAGTANPALAGNGFYIDNVSLKSGNYSGAAFSIGGPATTIEGNSGTHVVAYNVNLSEPLPFTTTVNYATANDTATAGSDYVAASGTLTFAPGETSKVVNVTVNGDTTDEQLDENYKVNLSSPKSIGFNPGNESFPSYAAIDTGSKTTTIKDDDSTVRINDVTQNEGDSGTSPMVFTVSLDNASAVSVSVKAGTQNGSATQPSDYTANTQVLTFAPGDTSKTFSVSIKGDLTQEPNENFLVLLTQPVNTAIGDGTAAGVIRNDD